MTTLLTILFGVAFPVGCVFFYTLGLTHGISAKKGVAVKLKPLKAVADAVNDVKEANEKREQTKEELKRAEQIRQMMAWNGDKK